MVLAGDITYKVLLLLEAGNKARRLIKQIRGRARWGRRGRAVSMAMEKSRDGRHRAWVAARGSSTPCRSG